MTVDYRIEVARYYDLNPKVPDDIPFYEKQLPSRNCTLLELGCGTGRVLLPLARRCAFIQGIDQSRAMLEICQERLQRARISARQARADSGDITALALGRRFDLVIAPFRVMQNLETDEEVDGLFRSIREHLAPGGTCILNVFRPAMDSDTLRREWCTDVDRVAWEVPFEGDRVVCYDRRRRMDPVKLVLYPELVYRRYSGAELKDEAVLKLVMRCYYPDEFERLIEEQGFEIMDRWGGYSGEAYGRGNELVVQFRLPAA
jgi:SAM-dependent methyltransferase